MVTTQVESLWVWNKLFGCGQRWLIAEPVVGFTDLVAHRKWLLPSSGLQLQARPSMCPSMQHFCKFCYWFRRVHNSRVVGNVGTGNYVFIVS